MIGQLGLGISPLELTFILSFRCLQGLQLLADVSNITFHLFKIISYKTYKKINNFVIQVNLS